MSAPGRVDQIGVVVNEQKGEELHHIRFAIDHRAVRDDMRARGVHPYQEGASLRGVEIRDAYDDTVPALGFLIETLNIGENQ